MEPRIGEMIAGQGSALYHPTRKTTVLRKAS
jgi:hypothetical protein